MVFFTGVVLAYRGLGAEVIALFPMTYYICATAGRMFFGYLAKWLKDMAAIRIDLALAFSGVVVLLFTNNLAGMVLAGFGMAPILFSILHDTTNRFSKSVVAKLGGYEISAFGAGMAVLFFAMGQILGRISLEILFPISMGFMTLTFLLNELLEFSLNRTNSYALRT